MKRRFKRGKSYAPFIKIDHKMMDSPAYRSLSPAERAVYYEIVRRYNGFNNSNIPLSCREAGRLCNISNATASRAFRTLCERGFIKVARASGFNVKGRMATRWTLTNHAIEGGYAPTNDWQTWRPEAVEK